MEKEFEEFPIIFFFCIPRNENGERKKKDRTKIGRKKNKIIY